MTEPVGFKCPSCGQPAAIAFADQAMCGTETCRVLTWDPSKTLDENLDGAQSIDLPDLPQADL
jgi:hypothetical protein